MSGVAVMWSSRCVAAPGALVVALAVDPGSHVFTFTAAGPPPVDRPLLSEAYTRVLSNCACFPLP